MSQGITTYAFDAAQQMTDITTSYGGTAGPQVAFNYDNASRLTSISRQIGSGGTATEVNTIDRLRQRQSRRDHDGQLGHGQSLPARLDHRRRWRPTSTVMTMPTA